MALRIIRDRERPAPFNMAADQLLLVRAAPSNGITIRFYGWSPPAISLGCMQNGAHLDHPALAQSGVGWVKRPTGGRAVLHWNDITYSCTFSSRLSGMGTAISESYALLSRCLMNGLETAGVVCEAQDSATEFHSTKRDIQLPCFLSPNRGEIMVGGRKLAGSAQKRTVEAVLQHGSLPIDGSFRRLPGFLAVSALERERQNALLERKCICLEEVLGYVDKERVIDCLIKGFATMLGIEAVEKPWDKDECAEIERSAVEN